jgi:hypothetical protein
MAGVCDAYKRGEKFIPNFGGQPDWNSPIGRPRGKQEGNIKTNLIGQK